MLFDASAATTSSATVIKAIRKTLSKVGGSSFFLTYLEQVCDDDTKGEPKWRSVENMRTALRALLEHHKTTALRLAALEDEESTTQGRMDTINTKAVGAAVVEGEEEELAALAAAQVKRNKETSQLQA